MHARTTHPTGIPGQDRHGWSQWHIIWSMAIVTALGLALGSPSLVQARTFHCRGGDVACLIAAIKQANVQPGPRHEIRLEAGTYSLTVVDNTTDGANGLPSITSRVTIRGIGADLTVIERYANALDFRLLHIAATGMLTLEGLTIKGGRVTTGDTFVANSGGGIFNNGTLIISSSMIYGNSANFGGGILSFIGPTITIADSVITGNSAVDGGGIFIFDGKATIDRSFISSNTGTDRGGGIFPTGDSLTTITESTISDNSADRGGGIFNNGSTVTIGKSTFSNNRAQGNDSGANGGGIWTARAMTITDSSIVSNESSRLGGGIFAGGLLSITSSTIANNTTGADGGGIFAHTADIILTNSTIAGNIAETHGGGISKEFHEFSIVRVVNTILALNYVLNGIGQDCFGSVTSQGNNLISDASDCTITLLPSDLMGETGLGGFLYSETPGYAHYPLLQGSPAINTANPAVCPQTDQLGQRRLGTCDIGAIEFQSTVVSSR